jgi:hypothetical protein
VRRGLAPCARSAAQSSLRFPSNALRAHNVRHVLRAPRACVLGVWGLWATRALAAPSSVRRRLDTRAFHPLPSPLPSFGKRNEKGQAICTFGELYEVTQDIFEALGGTLKVRESPSLEALSSNLHP